MRINFNDDISRITDPKKIAANALHIGHLKDYNRFQQRISLERALLVERIAKEKGITLLNPNIAGLAILNHGS